MCDFFFWGGCFLQDADSSVAKVWEMLSEEEDSAKLVWEELIDEMSETAEAATVLLESDG